MPHDISNALKGAIVHITKAKISKRDSFVLKSSALEQALEQAGVHIDVTLYHMSGQIFFDTFYWPPNAKVEYERLYVRAGNVPRVFARAARIHVETAILPELVTWVQEILALPFNAPARGVEQRMWWPRPPQFDLTR